jgi:hypothetical protein
MLEWRKKIDYSSLTPKQKIALNLKLSMRKCNEGYKLTNFKGEITQGVLGTTVEYLPNCLDPDTKERKFEKFIPEKDNQESENLSLSKIADNMPIEFNFYPTDEIMQKLVMRSL